MYIFDILNTALQMSSAEKLLKNILGKQSILSPAIYTPNILPTVPNTGFQLHICLRFTFISTTSKIWIKGIYLPPPTYQRSEESKLNNKIFLLGEWVGKTCADEDTMGNVVVAGAGLILDPATEEEDIFINEDNIVVDDCICVDTFEVAIGTALEIDEVLLLLTITPFV